MMYLSLQLLFAFAAIGLFLVYFFVASVLDLPTAITAMPTIIVAALAFLFFLFFSCGLNASLLKCYTGALEGKKYPLAEFLRYALQKAPGMFIIMLMRDITTAIIASPLVVLYFYTLQEYEYMDFITGAYVLLAIFVVHFLFTPAFVSMGAFNTGIALSFRNGISFLKRKHVYAMALYSVFAFAWLLNFLPIVQLISIFAIYPIVYAAVIAMFQGSGTATYTR